MTMTSTASERGITIKVDDIVVQKKIPFNDEGMTALRMIRAHLQDELGAEQDCPVILPYPTALHLILLDYAQLRGINVNATEI